MLVKVVSLGSRLFVRRSNLLDKLNELFGSPRRDFINGFLDPSLLGSGRYYFGDWSFRWVGRLWLRRSDFLFNFLFNFLLNFLFNFLFNFLLDYFLDLRHLRHYFWSESP